MFMKNNTEFALIIIIGKGDRTMELIQKQISFVCLYFQNQKISLWFIIIKIYETLIYNNIGINLKINFSFSSSSVNNYKI